MPCWRCFHLRPRHPRRPRCREFGRSGVPTIVRGREPSRAVTLRLAAARVNAPRWIARSIIDADVVGQLADQHCGEMAQCATAVVYQGQQISGMAVA